MSNMNLTNDSIPLNIPRDSFQWEPDIILWLLETTALIILIILTVVGNLIVIVGVVYSPRLRSPTYCFIVNLAVADLLLGLVVLPISAARELFNYQLSPVVCATWSCLDVLCCTASILSLCALAAERHEGVAQPLRAPSASRARRRLLILWVAAAAIALAGLRAQPDGQPCTLNKHLGYVIFSACASFYLPALVMLGLWCRVYRAASRRSAHLARGHVGGTLDMRVHRGGGHNTPISQPQKLDSRKTEMELVQKRNEWLKSHSHHTTITIVTRSNESRSSTSSMSTSDGIIHTSEFSCTVHGKTSNNCTTLGYKLDRNVRTQSTEVKQVNKFEVGQNRAARTLALVVGGFLLCWCPFFIFLPIDAACSSCNVSKALTFSFWLGYFNSCINPFIYACSSREMRRAFRIILCKRHRRPTVEYR